MARRQWFDVPSTASPLSAATLNDLEARKPETAELPANAVAAGADRVGIVDATAIIQALINGNSHTYVPWGTYRIDGTLTVDEYRTLELAPGCYLTRSSTYTAATTPIVRLMGSLYSRLIGQGTVTTNNDCPTGIVHVGPATQTVTTNIQRWRVWDVSLVGQTPISTDIGLNITSSQSSALGSGSGSNYLGSVRDVDIRDVGIGIKFGELCNAHQVSGVLLHNIGVTSYLLAGGASLGQAIGNNNIFGGFTHTKASGNITCIKATGYVQFNMFTDVKAEPDAPGVPGSLYYDLGANTSQNRIIGFGNFETAPQGTDAGVNNVILDEDSFKLPGVIVGQAPSSGLGTGWVEMRRADFAGPDYVLGQNSSGIVLINSKNSDIRLRANGAEQVQIGSGTIGFYGTSPVSKPTGVAVTAAGVHAALVTLGLIAA